MFNRDFYPTPPELIQLMLKGIDFDYGKIKTVLEPSAGKGDIVDIIVQNRNKSLDIDCIEIDPNLRHILKGKGYRVVHDDFLPYTTYKHYDLIILNPPFSEGDKHLLKALEMQEQTGGRVVCLLNAETLRNQCANTRLDLARKLKEYSAEIQYIQDAFKQAERKTGVEIALIRVDVPATARRSIILDGLKQEEDFAGSGRHDNYMTSSDRLEAIVERYRYEVRAGLSLISEYNALQPLMLKSTNEDCNSPILQLKVDIPRDEEAGQIPENAYIEMVRLKYWRALFEKDWFKELLTNKLREEYTNKITDLRHYDFSVYNVKVLQSQIQRDLSQSIEDTIIALFDEFSYKYHWGDGSPNIHYYNGWKTNQSWKINKKVIIRLSAFYWGGAELYYTYLVANKLMDIEKALNYLDGGVSTEHVDLRQTLEHAQKVGETKNIQFKYFKVTFYKKGTTHIEFTNLDILKKFNLFGSQRKGWLPPGYGKARYKDMTGDEQKVVDSFEGQKEYERVMDNQVYFLSDFSKQLLLT